MTEAFFPYETSIRSPGWALNEGVGDVEHPKAAKKTTVTTAKPGDIGVDESRENIQTQAQQTKNTSPKLGSLGSSRNAGPRPSLSGSLHLPPPPLVLTIRLIPLLPVSIASLPLELLPRFPLLFPFRILLLIIILRLNQRLAVRVIILRFRLRLGIRRLVTLVRLDRMVRVRISSLQVKKLPPAFLYELLGIVCDRFQYGPPVEIEPALVILDISRVEPLLNTVERGRGYRVDPHHIPFKVFEHDRHVEILLREANALQVDDLDIGNGDDESRGLVRYPVKAEFAERLVELEVKAFELALSPQIVHSIHEMLKIGVDFVLPVALPLLLLDLVGVVSRPFASADVLDHFHHLDVKLDILGLLVADHDVVVEVKMDERDHLLLGRLEKRVLNVAVHYVDPLVRPRSREPEPIGMGLERARQLPGSAAENRPYPEVVQSDWLEPNEPLLSHKRGPLGPFGLAGHHVAPQRLYQLHDLADVARVLGPEGNLLEVHGTLVLQRVGVVRAEGSARHVEDDSHVAVSSPRGTGPCCRRSGGEWPRSSGPPGSSSPSEAAARLRSCTRLNRWRPEQKPARRLHPTPRQPGGEPSPRSSDGRAPLARRCLNGGSPSSRRRPSRQRSTRHEPWAARPPPRPLLEPERDVEDHPRFKRAFVLRVQAQSRFAELEPDSGPGRFRQVGKQLGGVSLHDRDSCFVNGSGLVSGLHGENGCLVGSEEDLISLALSRVRVDKVRSGNVRAIAIVTGPNGADDDAGGIVVQILVVARGTGPEIETSSALKNWRVADIYIFGLELDADFCWVKDECVTFFSSSITFSTFGTTKFFIAEAVKYAAFFMQVISFLSFTAKSSDNPLDMSLSLRPESFNLSDHSSRSLPSGASRAMYPIVGDS
ncbi:AP2/B3-like transcriptional factor family protein [Striga asiatica]|uniref:AP2/B3-like transcriptional factor family protein n=1 Tax=Striga asiatica TaxID=4170 RepID=A0A5A7NYY2_STRAF|nr:AP2/B3-like transcriptional factor family protein [Striga asiatica]